MLSAAGNKVKILFQVSKAVLNFNQTPAFDVADSWVWLAKLHLTPRQPVYEKILQFAYAPTMHIISQNFSTRWPPCVLDACPPLRPSLPVHTFLISVLIYLHAFTMSLIPNQSRGFILF